MTTRLNAYGYADLCRGDLEWLAKQPRTLERDHIAEIIIASLDHEYGHYHERGSMSVSPLTESLRNTWISRMSDEEKRCSIAIVLNKQQFLEDLSKRIPHLPTPTIAPGPDLDFLGLTWEVPTPNEGPTHINVQVHKRSIEYFINTSESVWSTTSLAGLVSSQFVAKLREIFK